MRRLRKMPTEKQLKNWDGYKKWLRTDFLPSRLPPELIDVFMRRYEKKYDKFAKPMICPKLAVTLMNDYFKVRKLGTQWYACVGKGGMGKSTLMANVFYWLDDKFTIEDSNLDIKGFVKALAENSDPDSHKAFFMDEPDDEIHPSSKEGKGLRSVLGKARQGKFYFGICATDMRDIPLYIFRKIDKILFVPKHGEYIYFQDNPDIGEYILTDIRNAYMEKKGYQVFFDLAKKGKGLLGITYEWMPFEDQVKSSYLTSKWDDYQKDIDALNNVLNPKSVDAPTVDPKDARRQAAAARLRTLREQERQYYRDLIRVEIFEKGKTVGEVKREFGISSTMWARHWRAYEKSTLCIEKPVGGASDLNSVSNLEAASGKFETKDEIEHEKKAIMPDIT